MGAAALCKRLFANDGRRLIPAAKKQNHLSFAEKLSRWRALASAGA
jgi:hypothetical protein